MGTTLTGTTPQDTYDSLIKVTDNGPLSGTAKYLSDGLGNDSVLALSTSRVGVGTTSPSVALHTNGVIRSANSGNTVFTEVQNDGLYATATDLYLLAPATKFVSIYAGGAESMRITSAGNVGIGTSSPASKLDVYVNAANSSINVNHAVNSGTIPQYAGISFGAPSTLFGGDAKYTGGAGVQSVNTAVSGNETDLRFWTTTGGSPSEKVRILAGGGLTFNGDTAAANALDDYEEGTWTPSVQSNSGSATYSTREGWYTKIGRQVTITFFISFQKNTLSGPVQLRQLPFTIGNFGNHYPQAQIMLDNLASAYDNPLLQLGNNSTVADVIVNNGSTTSHNAMDATQLGAGTMAFRGTATYFV